MAAGHPLTAQAGADVLRAGGNAVDAAVACVLMSFVTESPLTGPGAGGFMLVHTAAGEDHLLDFFVAAPGQGPRDARAGRARADRRRVRGRGDPALQHRAVVVRRVRHDARARRGARRASAPCRWPTWSRAPAQVARDGHELTPIQAYLVRILGPILASRPEGQAIYAPEGRFLREGETLRFPSWATCSSGSARRGPRRSTRATIGGAGERLRARARRPAHARGPRVVPGRRARAGPRPLPRPRRAHEPAAVVRRHPDRVLARPARAAWRAPATCARWSR